MGIACSAKMTSAVLMPQTPLENSQTRLGVCLSPSTARPPALPPPSNPRSNLTHLTPALPNLLSFSACMFGGAMCLQQPQAGSLY